MDEVLSWRQRLALDWVEQWRACCAGKPAPLRAELDAPHGRVLIHGRKDDRHKCVATFVREADDAVVPLASGDYPWCADACARALSGKDAVWDGEQFPPPAVIARQRRRFFTPVQGWSVVGAIELFGGVVLLGVDRGVWSFLFHDGRRSEWLAPMSRTFDLDGWLRDHPAPAAPPPSPPPPPLPPPSPRPPSSPTSSASGTTPPPAPPAPPTAPAGGEPVPPPTASERRRQTQAAQKDAELREQLRHAAQKDAELRDQQRQVVVGPDPDPDEDGPSDSDTARACLLRLPDRAPAGQSQLIVEWFAKLLIAIGEAGYFGNLYGRKADIAATCSRILGKAVCAKMLGLALTILKRMDCCLIELVNGKWWTVKLNGLANRTSTQHQALLAETPIGFQLQRVKVPFRGRRPILWEVPRNAATGEAARSSSGASNASADRRDDAAPSRAPAGDAPVEHDAPPTAASPETSPAADPAGGVGEAALRHQLTMAHGMLKLAHQRREEDRVTWQREKAALEQRVAAAEEHAQKTAAELAVLGDRHDALLAKLATVEQTAERTGAALVDKLERATAALVAATEHLDVERQQRAVEADRHAVEVARLAREAEESRQREAELRAERDRHAADAALPDGQDQRELEPRAKRDPHAAEAARLARLADGHHRRELELRAERNRDTAEAACQVRLAEEHDHPAPRIAGRDRQVAPGEPHPGAVGISSLVVTCVACTVATLTFTVARRARARPDLAHETAACTPASGGRDTRSTPACFPWIDPAASTIDLGAQGPRGPPDPGG